MTESRISGAGTPIQGVTLYSFTRSFHAREYDLDSLIRRVAAERFGPGLELVGFQSIRGFPKIDDTFVGWFRDLVDELGLLPTTMSINTDLGLRRDRLLTEDERVAYMEPQLRAAAQLGFSAARVQISLTPDAMENLLPLAEQYGITLALEVHAHQHGQADDILRMRDRYDRIGSPLLGFTMDWGSTTTAFAPSALESYRRRGASDGLLDAIVTLWNEYYSLGAPADDREHGERFSAFMGLGARHGRPDLGIDLAINGTGIFGPARVDSWREILPWVRHVHGKFFGIDAAGDEPSVPVRELVALLVEIGYTGAISSEYEGWHWNNWDDAFDIIRGVHAVQRSAAQAAGSHMITNVESARNALAAELGHPAGVA
jgi:sugar phosphate isomerase/epimerase